MGSYRLDLKDHFKIYVREYIHIFVTAVAAGFALSFSMWGEGSAVDIATGIGNWVLFTIIMFFSMLLHVVGAKLMAVRMGVDLKFFMWKLGVLFGLIVTFFTNGMLPLFFAGYTDGTGIPRLRVGKYPIRFKVWEHAVICFSGIAANLIIVLIMKPLFMATDAMIFRHIIKANLLLMVFAMLPIPLFHGIRVIETGRTAYDFHGGTAGFNIFFGNRGLYVLVFGLVLVYALLAFFGGIFSFFLSLFIGLILMALFYIFVEVSP
ncbi:hypothetical protein ACFL1B_05670 [Nanoarchaeota archaeon]